MSTGEASLLFLWSNLARAFLQLLPLQLNCLVRRLCRTIVSCSRVLLCTKYSLFRTKSTNKQHQLILFLSQVEELELSKIKATDLLKAHDGDAGKALRAYIAPVA